MSEDTRKTEELKKELIDCIFSDNTKNLFVVNGQDYSEQFKKIFADKELLDNTISQYLNLIKSLPDTKFSTLGNADILKLASKIIRSIIPQLDALKDKDTGFFIDKSLMVFAGQDVLDYTDSSSPTLKLRFSMLCNSLLNSANPGNQLKLLSPIKENFEYRGVTTVLEQPKNVIAVKESLEIFSQKGLDENKVSIAAYIFAGIIAKLAGKKSLFDGPLPEELIIAAQKKAIELAMLCSNKEPPILSAQDTAAAINLGKAFGKATRDQLHPICQQQPKLASGDLQEACSRILTENYQASLDLLNKPIAKNKPISNALSAIGGLFKVQTMKLPFPQKEALSQVLIPNHNLLATPKR